MNIEQAIDILKKCIADYVIGEYCEKCADNKICDDRNEDCYFQQAIDMVITAYEKEKEEPKKECHNCDEYTARLGELETENRMLKSELEKQSKEIEELKEENKEIRDWKYVIDNPIDLKKLSELDIIKIFGKSYIAKDIIKARIKELEEYLYRGSIKDDFLMIRIKAKIQELQSLLEKE